MHYTCSKIPKTTPVGSHNRRTSCMVQKSKSRPPNTRGKGKKTRGAYCGKDEEKKKKSPTHSTWKCKTQHTATNKKSPIKNFNHVKSSLQRKNPPTPPRFIHKSIPLLYLLFSLPLCKHICLIKGQIYPVPYSQNQKLGFSQVSSTTSLPLIRKILRTRLIK